MPILTKVIIITTNPIINNIIIGFLAYTTMVDCTVMKNWIFFVARIGDQGLLCFWVGLLIALQQHLASMVGPLETYLCIGEPLSLLAIGFLLIYEFLIS